MYIISAKSSINVEIRKVKPKYNLFTSINNNINKTAAETSIYLTAIEPTSIFIKLLYSFFIAYIAKKYAAAKFIIQILRARITDLITITNLSLVMLSEVEASHCTSSFFFFLSILATALKKFTIAATTPNNIIEIISQGAVLNCLSSHQPINPQKTIVSTICHPITRNGASSFKTLLSLPRISLKYFLLLSSNIFSKLLDLVNCSKHKEQFTLFKFYSVINVLHISDVIPNEVKNVTEVNLFLENYFVGFKRDMLLKR